MATRDVPCARRGRRGQNEEAAGGRAGSVGAAAASAASASRLIRSFSSLPGLKYGTFFGGTSTLSPVFGLRPLRGSRLRSRKLPNPRSSIFSPRCSASMMLLKTVSTITSECFFVRSETRDTSSTSSALVMLPPGVFTVAPHGPRSARAACHRRRRRASGAAAVELERRSLPVLEVVAEGGVAGALVLAVLLPVGAVLVGLERADAQPDLPLLRAQLDDLHLVAVAHLEVDLLAPVGVVELRHVDEPFDALVELDERAEVGHARHLALDGVAHLVTGEEVVPDVGGELLETERQPLVLGVDAEHHRLDHVALLQHLRRVLHALAPRHVGDVNQAVDVLFDLDERAELGEVAHLALDARTHRVLLGELVPRVALDLLEAQRDAPCRRIHAEHHRVDVVADVEDLRRVLDALAPRHLGDVDEPLDARFELDEGAVVGEADHLTAHARADRVAVLHRGPRILHELLVAERDALGGGVVLEDDDVHFVVDLEELRRVADAAPRHVRDVQQAVDAAEVDEGAVVGDVLHRAAQRLALGQRLERGLLLLGVLLFEEGLAREDDVAALLVDLDDAHAQFLTAQGIQVANRADVDLRAGQERAHADIHGEATLDALDDAADDDLAVGIRLLDLVPDLHLLGLLARQHDVAVAILGALEEDVDHVPRLHRDLSVLVEELVDGNQSFGLVANVHDHRRFRNPQHGALDDLALRHVAEAVVVELHQRRKLVGVYIVALHGLEGRTGRFTRSCAPWSGLTAHQFGRHQPILCVCHS